MKEPIIRLLFFICLPVLIYSCSETKSLAPGQYLYDGAKIKISAKPPLSRSKSNDLKS